MISKAALWYVVKLGLCTFLFLSGLALFPVAYVLWSENWKGTILRYVAAVVVCVLGAAMIAVALAWQATALKTYWLQ